MRDTSVDKLIHIVRDPRDIVISGAHYFPIGIPSLLVSAATKGFLPRKLYNAKVKFIRLFAFRSGRINFMIKSLIEGHERLNPWLKLSWPDYIRGFVQRGIFVVRFEDLINNPEFEAQRILAYLGLVRELDVIHSAIQRQSFEKRRNEFLKLGQNELGGFMRTGLVEQWKSELNADQCARIESACVREMKALGYNQLSTLT